jgi:hypothetical protein
MVANDDRNLLGGIRRGKLLLYDERNLKIKASV